MNTARPRNNFVYLIIVIAIGAIIFTALRGNTTQSEDMPLSQVAALINSGHPSLLDFTDGSQSDRGVYGGPKPLVDNGVPNYPWAVNVTASPNLVGVGTPINAGATVRVGPAY